MSLPTARAKLLGSVQGVVVQASIFMGPISSGFCSKSKATVIAGSCLGLVASSNRISKFESGVSAPQE